jgi:hypothetical protein
MKSESQKRQLFKEEVTNRGRRTDRVRAFNSLRNDARSAQIEKLRQSNSAQLINLPATVSISKEHEAWAAIELDGVTAAANEIRDLLDQDCLTLMRRCIAALFENPNSYIVYSIADCTGLLDMLAVCLSADTANLNLSRPQRVELTGLTVDQSEYFFLALELSIQLSNSRIEVKTGLIDRGVVAAVAKLLQKAEELQQASIINRALFFFVNLASDPAELMRTLAVNHGLPRRCLQMLSSILAAPECSPEMLDIARLIGALLTLMCKSPYDWNQHLSEFADVWVRAMRNFNPVDPNITVNLAFALADLSSFVQHLSLHQLVPIYLETGLLQCIAECDYPEREIVTVTTINRLFCTTDEFVLQYLLPNEAVMNVVREGVQSLRGDIRSFGFNTVANICAVPDSSVHDALYHDSARFFHKLVAVIHVDEKLIKRFAVTAVSNILNFGTESHRNFFCNQPVFIQDLIDLMTTTDTDLLSDLLESFQLLLEHVRGNKKSLVWTMFKQFDVESKLNTLFYERSDGPIGGMVQDLLFEHFEYEPVPDDDFDIEFEGSSDNENVVVNWGFDTPLTAPLAMGQQKITSWLTSTSGKMFAQDRIDTDMYAN